MKPQLYDEMAKLESSHFWFRARREVLAACLSKFIPREVQGVVLDAGCGIGANVRVLGKFGKVFGIDVFHEACLYANHKNPGQFAQGGLEALPVRDSSIDIVALLDVLEHVDDQQTVLSEICRVLRPGGLLLITVPAFRHLWSGHDIIHQHRRRYLANELRQELGRNGMRIDYLSYFNTHLYPLVALTRLLKKVGVNSSESDMRAPPEWLNNILFAIFRAECLWIGRFFMPFGVSLIAVAKKG